MPQPWGGPTRGGDKRRTRVDAKRSQAKLCQAFPSSHKPSDRKPIGSLSRGKKSSEVTQPSCMIKNGSFLSVLITTLLLFSHTSRIQEEARRSQSASRLKEGKRKGPTSVASGRQQPGGKTNWARPKPQSSSPNPASITASQQEEEATFLLAIACDASWWGIALGSSCLLGRTFGQLHCS